MVIMKFGGTSVEDAPAIERVAEIVRTREKLRPVVVVSALAKVTDSLVLLGQSAATGDSDAALKLSNALRARHLETTLQLLGRKSSASVTQQIEQIFVQLDDFVRGLAAVREVSPPQQRLPAVFRRIVVESDSCRGIHSARLERNLGGFSKMSGYG